MPNNLEEVIPSLLATGLNALRQRSIMPRLVNNSYSTLASKKGDTIDVPISSSITATAVTPAATAPDPGDTTPTSVPIAMNQWFEAAFELSDKDQLEAEDMIMPMQASEAIKSLANNVDNYILGLYQQFYGVAGDAAVVAFSDGTAKDATDMKKVLSNQLTPTDDRWAVTDANVEASASNVRAFQDLSWNGSPQGIIEGELNRKMGFGWWMDQNVPLHTAGTGTGYLVNGVHAVDATSIAINVGSGTIVVGDILTFAGDPQTYVATSALAAPGSVSISPALRVATAGGEAVAITASHVVNLGFHRDAIAFASRPLRRSKGGGIISATQVDPVSGLALRVEVTEEYKRQRFSYDILYGSNVVRPEFGVRLLSKPE
jgi:hypothetical protein